MSDTSANYIDFEKWSALAVSDPEKFEQLRQDKISAFIEKADQTRQNRLRGLQWSVDRIRDKHTNSSMGACLALSQLMWKTFAELSEQLEAYENAKNTAPNKAPDQADIIPFTGKPKA